MRIHHASRPHNSPLTTPAQRGAPPAAPPAVPPLRHRGFAAYAGGVLGYNLAVIVWGVYVRATASGAGCGGHWPLCNGAVLPPSPSVQTVIEFTHRLSSGLDVLLVLGLVVGAWRLFPPRHGVRRAAALALLLTFTEALLGAALVLFGLVNSNSSAARVAVLSLHQTNTLLMLAAFALTVWWAAGGPRLDRRPRRLIALLDLAGAGLVATAVLGTVAALGDTLLPARSLAAGLRADTAAGSGWLVHLRALHPLFALVVGFFLIALASRRLEARAGSPARIAPWLIAAVFVQWSAGVADLVLLAPVPMQLVHVLCADLVWIAFILFTASVLARPAAAAVSG